MTKWAVEILFCVESHVFAKAAKSLKASEGNQDPDKILHKIL